MRVETMEHPQLQVNLVLKEVWRQYLRQVIQYLEYRPIGLRAIY